MTLSRPSFLAALINALMPPQAAAEVAVSHDDDDAPAVAVVRPTPMSVLAIRPAASETFSLFEST